MYVSVHLLTVLLYIIGTCCSCLGQLEQGYSRIQYGYRLDSRTIDTFEISFLDCVEECLVTTRCKSVNYYKGANYCETNFEDKASAEMKYSSRPGWVYSERGDWPRDMVGPCSVSACGINQKCQYLKYSENKSFDCVLSDCGIPQRHGVDFDNTLQGEAIAIYKGMHVRCSEGFEQWGSGRLICRPSGEWEYNIVCVEKGWTKYRYLDHVYFLFEEELTWEDAKTDCTSRGAYLVEIDSAEENTWIKESLVIPIISNPLCLSSSNVWIGGYRQYNETVFRWSGSKRLLDYTNWNPRNPDNYLDNEHCIEMNSNGEWNDMDCSRKRPHICEMNYVC